MGVHLLGGCGNYGASRREYKLKKYMVRNNITCLSLPAQSPDLIMIENVWLYIKRKLQFCSGAVKSKADLIEEITFRACMAQYQSQFSK